MTSFDPALRGRLVHSSSRSRLSLRHLRRSLARPGTPRQIVPFWAEVEQWRDVQLLRLHGELDAGGVDLLADVLVCEHQIAVRRGAELRLDLSAVTFIDSEALSALLQAREASEAVDQAFTIGDAGRADLPLFVENAASAPRSRAVIERRQRLVDH